MSDYFCLACKKRFSNDTDWNLHGCNPVFKMVDGKLSNEVSEVLQLKPTRWGRFKDRLLSVDISWWLAASGILIMNWVFIAHFKFSFVEGIFEGFGIGLAIPRLLNR